MTRPSDTCSKVVLPGMVGEFFPHSWKLRFRCERNTVSKIFCFDFQDRRQLIEGGN